jgi:ABC-type glutathione transport system ATPase component
MQAGPAAGAAGAAGRIAGTAPPASPAPAAAPLPAGSGVELQEVTKSFDGVTAVDAVTLAVRAGELFSLLGPSGCGKTTPVD